MSSHKNCSYCDSCSEKSSHKKCKKYVDLMNCCECACGCYKGCEKKHKKCHDCNDCHEKPKHKKCKKYVDLMNCCECACGCIKEKCRCH